MLQAKRVNRYFLRQPKYKGSASDSTPFLLLEIEPVLSSVYGQFHLFQTIGWQTQTFQLAHPMTDYCNVC